MDWNKIDEENKKEFKDYVANGDYDVKLDSVVLKTFDNGGMAFKFAFEETDTTKYPEATRSFFSDEKKNFRCYHYRNLMMVLGASKENAQKAVEACEGGKNREAVADKYAQAFNRLAQKHPVVKIEVRDQYDRDGKPRVSAKGKTYQESEFKDPSVYFPSNKKSTQSGDILPSDGEVTEDDLSNIDLPF